MGNYPPTLWSIHDAEVETNNHVEAWHSKLKKVLRKAHRNVFELVEVFQREQAVVEVTISQLESGGRPRQRSSRLQEKERKIQEVKQRFSNNTITLEEYVRAISAFVGF